MNRPIPSPDEVLAQVRPSLREAGRLVLCHIVRAEGSTPGKSGWRLLVKADGAVVGNLGGGAFEALVKNDASRMLSNGHAPSELKRYYFTEEAVRGEPTGMVCGGFAEVYLETMVAPPVFVICGGGPVGQALAAVASPAGYDLLVIEDREDFMQPDLYPPGTCFRAVGRDFEEDFLSGEPGDLPMSGRDIYVAIVTRCWETDTAALAGVLRQRPPRLQYLGLMGSRRKIRRVRSEVEGRGFDLSSVELRAPIGLPIGGDTPGEIAISILAEMIGHRYRDDEVKADE